MIALTDAVIQLLITEVTALGGRVFDGIAPDDWRFPMAIVTVNQEHDAVLGLDAGFERATVTIRVSDEVTAVPSERAAVAQRVYDVMTRRDQAAPELHTVLAADGHTPILHGWVVESVSRIGASSYPEAIEGHRLMHMALQLEVVGERTP